VCESNEVRSNQKKWVFKSSQSLGKSESVLIVFPANLTALRDDVGLRKNDVIKQIIGHWVTVNWSQLLPPTGKKYTFSLKINNFLP
jgi:hypothetical protein